MNIKNLTLHEKIGQMLCLAYHGTEMNEQINTLVSDLKVGGLIAFARNIFDVEQIHHLNDEIQKLAEVPLFLGIDQEGGTVRRINDGITPLPGAMMLSAGDSLKSVRNINYRVGKELRALGFNMNFAPVADVNNNPYNPVINSRSFSDEPDIVATYALAAANGLQMANVLPTIKHFPGHGDTNVDSHLGLPVVNKSIQALKSCEIAPFKSVIDVGIDGVMLSHVLYPALDEQHPASLSKNIITNLLKKEMGFTGLVVTDSLTMGAIAKSYTNEEILINAVNAGVDLLIFCGKADLEEQKELFNVFVSLVESGKIPIERIDESVQKLLYYKKKYNITNDLLKWEEVASQLARKKDLDFALSLYQQGVTYHGTKPFRNITSDEKVLVLFPEIKVYSLVDNETNSSVTLGSLCGFDEMIYNENSDINSIKERIATYDQIILCLYNVGREDYQTRIFNSLPIEKTITVSMRSPYDILYIEKTKKHFYIYEPTKEALLALNQVLHGAIVAKGKLPVKIEEE